METDEKPVKASEPTKAEEPSNGVFDPPPAKITKIEPESATPEDHGTILLDICCRTGTIRQCLLKNIQNTQKVCCIGIEMITVAVEDARQNAKQNKMEKCCKYIAGKDTFRSIRHHLPNGFNLRKSRVVGVLDPPRARMHEKVILACR